MGDGSFGGEDDSSSPEPPTADDYRVPVDEPELEAILATIDDAVFIFSVERADDDISFRFQWNNTAHESLTGMSIDEFGGLRPREFLGDEVGTEVAANYRACVKQRDTIEYEETLRHETGQITWHTKLTPVIEDDRVVQIIGIARDISDRVARTKHLQVVDRVLRHNLRNTLNLILGQARDIEAETEPPTTDRASGIIDSSNDLLETSTKARMVTEVITDTPPATPMQVDSLVEQVVSVFAEMDHPADIAFPVAPSKTIVASPRLSEAIVELVRNAIVHHDRPSPSIEIATSVDDEILEIQVIDDGPGIPEMERAILEDGQPPSELSHGTGLGVWLVYWLVTKSGGSITAADREPRGSVVTLQLPHLPDDREVPSK
ncbi:PAS domain-containing sensor histidine kinase [Halorarius halobius]|uniref:PAS domain-containing sensor histidine kinase n=1 Tax=Halorarius halobius TaxID=2962671 RepID=UPI0020CF7D54|nr:PAS domain-containing sensor histidine kinase [Halorarius halobius]